MQAKPSTQEATSSNTTGRKHPAQLRFDMEATQQSSLAAYKRPNRQCLKLRKQNVIGIFANLE
jgi:hypothetical protein